MLAHALTPGHGHDKVWKAMARRVGIDGRGIGSEQPGEHTDQRSQRDDSEPKREVRRLCMRLDLLGGRLLLLRADELEVGKGSGPIHHFHQHTPRPADRFSTEVWERTAGIRAEIMELDFVRSLAAGTLGESQFGYYLAQDARYLNGYSRALARASGNMSAAARARTRRRSWCSQRTSTACRRSFPAASKAD